MEEESVEPTWGCHLDIGEVGLAFKMVLHELTDLRLPEEQI